jgi:site-specific DNA-cytosine methylase
VLSQVIFKLELFCGGGGLSYMSQQGDNVKIVSCWANDINPSACATYVCNKPYAIVSAQQNLPPGGFWRRHVPL